MRRLFLLGLAGSLPLAVAVAPSPAMAGGPLHYNGAAPGTLACANVNVHVVFSSALTTANAGTVTVARSIITAKSCVASQTVNPTVTIARGTTNNIHNQVAALAGNIFEKSALNCPASTLTGGEASSGGSFSLTWVGQLQGTYNNNTWSGAARSFTKSDVSTADAQVVVDPSIDPLDPHAGKVGITFPGSSGSATVSGSFTGLGLLPGPASGTLYSQYTPALLASKCGHKGIKVINFKGTLNFG